MGRYIAEKAKKQIKLVLTKYSSYVFQYDLIVNGIIIPTRLISTT